MDPNQACKLFHSKRKPQRQPMDWGKIFANDANNKRSIFEIYK